LAYGIDKDLRVGFWRIRTGRRYFELQEAFVEIRMARR
jgi:hypothetical protein